MLLGAILLFAWLILVIRHPAKALPISLAAVLVIGLMAAWVLWEERLVNEQLARLDVRLAYQPDQCPADRPLKISVHNGSSTTLLDLAWIVQAYRPGDDLNLAESPYEAERSLGPPRLQAGTDWQDCLPLPPLRRGYRADTLEFRAERLHGRFAD